MDTETRAIGEDTSTIKGAFRSLIIDKVVTEIMTTLSVHESAQISALYHTGAVRSTTVIDAW